MEGALVFHAVFACFAVYDGNKNWRIDIACSYFITFAPTIQKV